MLLDVLSNVYKLLGSECFEIKASAAQIKVGDTVKLSLSVTEGAKERLQSSEGVVIAKKNLKFNACITIRKIIHGVGIERMYPLNSPKLKSVEILRSSKIRRSKLYYLRTRSGKSTRLQQRFS